MAGDIVSDIGCGVRLFRGEILEEINLYGDLHRFLYRLLPRFHVIAIKGRSYRPKELEKLLK